MSFQASISFKSTLEMSSDAFPQLAPEIRRKQLWLLVWYESNIQLEIHKQITDEYVASFDGIFNGTLSYRSDSFINHNFYGQTGNVECNIRKSPNIQFKNRQWEEIKSSAIAKPR